VNSPPPKPEVILTNFFAEPTVLLVPITSRVITYNIRQSMLKLPTHSGFNDLFLNYSTWIISSPAAVALLYHVMQLTWFL
jgi:hypothetical protein